MEKEGCILLDLLDVLDVHYIIYMEQPIEILSVTVTSAANMSRLHTHRSRKAMLVHFCLQFGLRSRST